MNHKPLGRTGLTLPEIGIGTWQYHGGVQPIQKAITLGAAFVDTAETYGSEAVVGEAIKSVRSRVFLATKVSWQHADPDGVRAAAERSLKALQTDYIDLYQLHAPNPRIPIEDTMGAMEDLVQAGKVRFIGVSNFSARQLARAMAAMRRHRIVSNQVSYSLIDRNIEADRLLSFCQREAVTVIAYSPLGRGLPHLAARDPGNTLGRVAAAIGKTPAQVALNWCLTKDAVIAIPKASSEERVAENCQASGWHLTADHVRLLETHISYRRRGPVVAALRRTAGWTLRLSGLR